MTFVDGDPGALAFFNNINDAWTAYTPTWASSGTQPVLGNNGAIVGRHKTIGKTVKVSIDLTIGSTTTVGTAFYNFSLPSTAANQGIHMLGDAAFFDTSLGGWNGGWTQVTANTATVSVFFDFPPPSASTFSAAQWSATHPVAPATGDVIRLSFEYEKA